MAAPRVGGAPLAVAAVSQAAELAQGSLVQPRAQNAAGQVSVAASVLHHRGCRRDCSADNKRRIRHLAVLPLDTQTIGVAVEPMSC